MQRLIVPGAISREILRWPFLAVLTASIVLVVVPPSVVLAIPGLKPLVHFISDAVPATRHYVKHSAFRDVAEVYFPLMLLLSPLHLVWMWQLGPRKNWQAEFMTSPIKATSRLLVVVALVCLVGFVTFLEGGAQLKILPWNESKLALALSGYIASGGGFFVALTALAFGCRGLANALRSKEDRRDRAI